MELSSQRQAVATSKLVRNVPVLRSIEMSPGLAAHRLPEWDRPVAIVALGPAPRMIGAKGGVGPGAVAAAEPLGVAAAGRRTARQSTRATSSPAHDIQSPDGRPAIRRRSRCSAPARGRFGARAAARDCGSGRSSPRPRCAFLRDERSDRAGGPSDSGGARPRAPPRSA